MASPVSVLEFLYKASTTIQDAFTNAAAAGWQPPTAHKIAVTSYDGSGLSSEGLPDEALRGRFRGKKGAKQGLTSGGYKISTHCPGGWNNITSPPEAVMLGLAAGSIQAPTNARTSTIGAGASTTVLPIASANTYCQAGQAVLVGVRGDGRGCGEVKPVVSCNAVSLVLGVACNAAPSENDAVAFSTTIYPDQTATQSYIEHLMIGHSAADQWQSIGGALKPSVSKMGIGERISLDYEVMCYDHRKVPSNELGAMTPTVAVDECSGHVISGTGAVQIGDYGSSARSVLDAGKLSFDPGISYVPIGSQSGRNGIGGYQRMPGQAKLELSLLAGEDDGIYDDFPSTPKTVIAQFGSAQGSTMAIEMRKCGAMSRPVQDDVEALRSWKVVLQDQEDGSTTELNTASFKIHIF